MTTRTDWPRGYDGEPEMIVYFSRFPDVTPRWDLGDSTVVLPAESMAELVEARR